MNCKIDTELVILAIYPPQSSQMIIYGKTTDKLQINTPA
jgi:hypothetical protein